MNGVAWGKPLTVDSSNTDDNIIAEDKTAMVAAKHGEQKSNRSPLPVVAPNAGAGLAAAPNSPPAAWARARKMLQLSSHMMFILITQNKLTFHSSCALFSMVQARVSFEHSVE